MLVGHRTAQFSEATQDLLGTLRKAPCNPQACIPKSLRDLESPPSSAPEPSTLNLYILCLRNSKLLTSLLLPLSSCCGRDCKGVGARRDVASIF